jgi:hypothetical protein
VSSTDTATLGTHSLKITYTPTASNFDWGARFESWSLGAYNDPKRVAWESPFREALADHPESYSLTFDVIWRQKGDGTDGIPQPPGWGANLSVAMDWGYALHEDPNDPTLRTGDGYSGWTQFNQLGLSNVTQPVNVVAVKIPLTLMVGAVDAKAIPANFDWIQLNLGSNGGWDPGQGVAVYYDNLRIRQDGDANSDGHVNADDYAIIDRAVAKAGLKGWENGDFNFDGVISGTDYALIDAAYAREHGAAMAADLVAAHAAAFGADYVNALAAIVPEPASLGGLAGLVALGVRRRRRRG